MPKTPLDLPATPSSQRTPPKNRLEAELYKLRAPDPALTLGTYVRDHLFEIIEQHDNGWSYAAIVQALGNLGVRDANGNPPNRAALYERIKAERARRSLVKPQPQARPQIGRLVKRKHSSEVL